MKATIFGLLFVTILLLPHRALAEPLQTPRNTVFDLITKPGFDNKANAFGLQLMAPQPPKPVKPVNTQPKTKTPTSTPYVVMPGDSLDKIAAAHKISWQRIWAKNTKLKDPNVIHIGFAIDLPSNDEALSQRPLPAAATPPPVIDALPAQSATTIAPVHNQVTTVVNYDSSNTYSYGYCTWYVKNRRGASLPNSLGNANTWFARAQALGMPTGYTPMVGAVGATTAGGFGHVVIVEAINNDGTITVSEMNYSGFGVQSSRTTLASEFNYIY